MRDEAHRVATHAVDIIRYPTLVKMGIWAAKAKAPPGLAPLLVELAHSLGDEEERRKVAKKVADQVIEELRENPEEQSEMVLNLLKRAKGSGRFEEVEEEIDFLVRKVEDGL